MEAKDLQAGFSVGVVRRLILQIFDANLSEESLHHSEQVVQSDASIYHDTLDLMELCQVGRIERLIAEDTINGEVLHRLELLLLRLLEEHLRANCRSMRPQDVLHCLFSTPAWTIANGTGQTVLVCRPHALFVLLGHPIAGDWVLAEECVLQVARRMTLRLEKRVKVPEGALHPTIRRHLIEAHGK